jgi:hypothetical protein
MLKAAKVWGVAFFLTCTSAYLLRATQIIERPVAAAAQQQAGAQSNSTKGAPQRPCWERAEQLHIQLPLPSTFLPDRLTEFQAKLAGFLKHGDYLNWCADKGLRDTGPFVNKVSLGVHPTVKIYYSSKIMKWLMHDRQGVIEDGAMIVKEQYTPPAAQYQLTAPEKVSDWTIMIKDSKGSKDGWYWAEIWQGQTPDSNKPPYTMRNTGFGLYCTRCHATAEKDHTFASLNNIEDFPGHPLSYFVDLSWLPTPTPTPAVGVEPAPLLANKTPPKPPISHHDQSDLLQVADAAEAMSAHEPMRTTRQPDPAFVKFFNSIAPVPLKDVKKIPPETYDHVWPDHQTPQQFLTSDSCMGCHSAIYYGNVMVYTGAQQADKTVPAMNVSPFGEWRWSPMGLAGRDPIFYSQLDSELAYLQTIKDPNEREKLTHDLINTCFSCHGVMGKRQHDIDHGGSANFNRDFVYLTDERDENFKYGALARDGISCLSCHHIVEDKTPPGEEPLKYFLEHAITGQFEMGKSDEAAGPFKDKEIVTDPMNNALGVKPKFDAYMQSSRMCGSCHTIHLPIVDKEGKPGKDLEQLTYLEWLNSSYQNEFGHNPKAQTCQDCHMTAKYSNAKGTFSVPLIQQPIATVEDSTYPATEGRLAPDKIDVRVRASGFARHQFQGLNVPLLEMFLQFMNPFAVGEKQFPYNEVLGVRQNDYMLGVNFDLPNAIDAFVQQAQNSTASIAVTPVSADKQKLVANVTVTNKAGHRLPSGVGFRRAFIELKVTDKANGQVVWCSGCTNELGIIVDQNGQPLPTEFFDKYKDKSGQWRQYFQPHFYDQAGHTITSQDQVEIYEELTEDASGQITTSFIRRDSRLKDNRLLPLGWTEQGPDPSLSGDFLEATHPFATGNDKHFKDGSGTSVVTYEVPLNGREAKDLQLTATLYYQTIPPYYLRMRFTQAADYPATKRLYYLTSNLKTSGTPIANWKLLLVSATVPAKR